MVRLRSPTISKPQLKTQNYFLPLLAGVSNILDGALPKPNYEAFMHKNCVVRAKMAEIKLLHSLMGS